MSLQRFDELVAALRGCRADLPDQRTGKNTQYSPWRRLHLSSLLATLNLLAFLFHSFLTFCDDAYKLIRATLPTRQTFFDPIRCLSGYHCFPSWAAMMDFMMRGLEIGPYAT
jgi:hypothetical protein